ncbi:MAG: type II toxin-antitoxin system HicB family antitoxin [Chloroflexi bacterium]|nr:type II toxin-antitoxin system HicB family antitoxin [Chloroflexota bacterium]
MSGGTIYVRDAHDGWVADIAELPGCMARGATKDEAAANVRRAFRDYLALLEKYGVSTEHWKDLDPATFAVKEAPAGEIPEDFRPMEEHEIRDFLHQMEGSRAALLALVRGLSADELERQPTPSTWSVRQALEHLMTTQASYLSKLEKWPENDFGTLQAVHRVAFQRFSILEPEDTNVDHTIQGRRWSTRRVMRRLLEHEYEHMQHITEILAALGSQRPPE